MIDLPDPILDDSLDSFSWDELYTFKSSFVQENQKVLEDLKVKIINKTFDNTELFKDFKIDNKPLNILKIERAKLDYLCFSLVFFSFIKTGDISKFEPSILKLTKEFIDHFQSKVEDVFYILIEKDTKPYNVSRMKELSLIIDEVIEAVTAINDAV